MNWGWLPYKNLHSVDDDYPTSNSKYEFVLYDGNDATDAAHNDSIVNHVDDLVIYIGEQKSHTADNDPRIMYGNFFTHIISWPSDINGNVPDAKHGINQDTTDVLPSRTIPDINKDVQTNPRENTAPYCAHCYCNAGQMTTRALNPADPLPAYSDSGFFIGTDKSIYHQKICVKDCTSSGYLNGAGQLGTWRGCTGRTSSDYLTWYDPTGKKRLLQLVKLGHKTLTERYCSWAAKAESVIIEGANWETRQTCNKTQVTWGGELTTLKDWYLDGDNYVEVNDDCPFFEIYPTTMDMMIHNNWLGRCSGTDEDDEYNWFVTFEGKAFGTNDDIDGEPLTRDIFTTLNAKSDDMSPSTGSRDLLWHNLPWYKSFGPFTEDQIREQWDEGSGEY